MHFGSHESPGHALCPRVVVLLWLAELPGSPLCLTRVKPPGRWKGLIYILLTQDLSLLEGKLTVFHMLSDDQFDRNREQKFTSMPNGSE